MQVTFLVGNGFDIGAGLKSSYGDFYKWYCAQNSPKPHIDKFRKEIKDDIQKGGKNWSDFEIGLGKYTAHFSKDTLQDFFDCYEDAGDKMLEYLELQVDRFEKNIDKASIDAFKLGLVNYLYELPPKEKKEIELIFPPKSNFNIKMKMVSFNYTSCLDMFVEKAAAEPLSVWNHGTYQYSMVLSPDVIHVHGTINNLPIFGVNDNLQIANKDLLANAIFRNVMIKPQSVVENGQLWHEEAHDLINSSDIICIYGMSLGATDSDWFESIMEWIRANSTHHLIIFWHTNKPSNGRSALQRTINRTGVKKLITDYSAFTNEMISEFSNRIHFVENAKYLFQVSLKEKKDNSALINELMKATDARKLEMEREAVLKAANS